MKRIVYGFLLFSAPLFGECYLSKLSINDSSIKDFLGEKIYLKAERLKFGEGGVFLESDNRSMLPISFIIKDKQCWFTIAPIVENGLCEKVILLCKTSEECEKERDEHVKEAVRETFNTALEVAGAAALIKTGQAGFAAAAAGAAALSADNAVEQAKKAYECHKEAQRERDNENRDKENNDQGFPGSRDRDSHDRMND